MIVSFKLRVRSLRGLGWLEGALEALDNDVQIPEVILEVALMVSVTDFSLSKEFVFVNSVSVDVVDEMRPPVQGESLVGVLDDLRLRAQLWERDVSAQHPVNFSEGGQSKLTDAALHDFASL